MATPKVPRADIDHAVARAFDAESAVVVSLRDAEGSLSALELPGTLPIGGVLSCSGNTVPQQRQTRRSHKL